MSDPERLWHTHAADPEVRGLLQSLRDVKPESGAGLRSWGAMAVKVAALPTMVALPGNSSVASNSAGGAPANAGVSASGRAFARQLAVAVLVPAALAGSAYAYYRAHRARAPAALIVAPIATPAPLAASETGEPMAEGTRTAEPRTPNVASSVSRTGRLEAEASMLAKGRRELRAGNARAAQATLGQLQSSFPKGVLGQEREVLAIEVLAANGDAAAAKRRAAQFLAAHPTSPYAAKVKRFADAT